MFISSLLVAFAIPFAHSAGPAKSTVFTVPSGYNEIVFVQGQPVAWGVNPGDQSDFYQHILSRSDGKAFQEYKIPVTGQVNEWGESRYDVFLDAIGSPQGVLKFEYGPSRQPVEHFELIDFLSGQIRRTLELQPRSDCWYENSPQFGANHPLYMKSPAGILYVRFCPIANSDDIFAEVANLTTGRTFATTLKFADPTYCATIPNERPGSIQDVTAVCWPEDWSGSSQSFTAHNLITGKTVWSAPIPASLIGTVYFKKIWHVSGRDAAILFEFSGGGESGTYLLPAGVTKQPIRLDDKPDYGMMNWHPEIGSKNGAPIVFGVLRDGNEPLSLNLTTGRIEHLAYAPWRLAVSPAGVVYAIAPSADELSYSVINTLTGATEAQFSTPHDQYSIWDDHDYGRTRRSIYYGEALDGVVAAADRIVFWTANPNNFESMANEITVVEIPF